MTSGTDFVEGAVTVAANGSPEAQERESERECVYVWAQASLQPDAIRRAVMAATKPTRAACGEH